MNRKYELLVFDWDGTLMDSEARIVACMQRAARDLAIAVPGEAATRDIIGLGLNEAITRLFPDQGEHTRNSLVEAYRDHWLGNEVAPAAMFAGAHELVERLHSAGYLLAVATGKSRRGLDSSLAESGLGAFFHMSRCADEAFSKPHPQMLQDILTDLNTAPGDTLVVGDTEYDMQMARNAGVAAVGMSHGVHTMERLLANGAMRCFDDLFQLSGWLHEPALNSADGV